jgi:5-dehydro-4-deoxyglucarate dehydratase
LFFAVTPFTPAGSIDLQVLDEHLRTALEAGAGGVFVACGTGELHALEPRKYAQAVRTAVDSTSGRVPVYAGTGGALPVARQSAQSDLEAGADLEELRRITDAGPALCARAAV